MEVGERIKLFREKKNLSTNDLSRLTGISQSTISKLENGKRKADFETLEIIANALDVYVHTLTGESASAIIEKAMEEKKMTLEEVAEKSGVSLHWLQNLDSFIPEGYSIDLDYLWITKVALVLGIPGSVLRVAFARQEPPVYDGEPDTRSLDEIFTDFDDSGIIDVSGLKTKKVPLLGNIAAGEPIFVKEEYSTYMEIDTEIKVDFCLRVKGDSMINARLNDGDIVFIRRQPQVENGEIAVILIDDEVTLKRFYKNNGGVILKSENLKYQPKYYSAEDFKEIRILGKAVLFQSEVI